MSTATVRLTALTAVAALALAGCSHSASTGTSSGGVTTLKVGASPTPHGDVLRYVRDHEAAQAGLSIDVVEFNDYVQPNKALQDKSLDANFFQHKPYLDAQVQQYGYKFTAVEPIFITPLAVYSHKLKKLADLPSGATVSVPNDPTNEARALGLLAKEGIITVKSGVTQATARDIASNPKKITIKELEAAQVPRSLDDVDAAVINENFARPAGLNPNRDSIAIESADNNPYANYLVVRTEDKDKSAVKKLAELLCSKQTQDYITQQFNGEVIVACPKA